MEKEEKKNLEEQQQVQQSQKNIKSRLDRIPLNVSSQITKRFKLLDKSDEEIKKLLEQIASQLPKHVVKKEEEVVENENQPKALESTAFSRKRLKHNKYDEENYLYVKKEKNQTNYLSFVEHSGIADVIFTRMEVVLGGSSYKVVIQGDKIYLENLKPDYDHYNNKLQINENFYKAYIRKLIYGFKDLPDIEDDKIGIFGIQNFLFDKSGNVVNIDYDNIDMFDDFQMKMNKIIYKNNLIPLCKSKNELLSECKNFLLLSKKELEFICFGKAENFTFIDNEQKSRYEEYVEYFQKCQSLLESILIENRLLSPTWKNDLQKDQKEKEKTEKHFKTPNLQQNPSIHKQIKDKNKAENQKCNVLRDQYNAFFENGNFYKASQIPIKIKKEELNIITQHVADLNKLKNTVGKRIKQK